LEEEMLRRRRFIPLVLIAAATGLWIGAAFGEDNQETRTAQLSQAPQVQPNPQLIQLHVQSAALPSSDDHSQIKTIAPQVPVATEPVELPGESPPVPSDRPNPSDPLAPMNRKVLNVNEKLDRTAVHPLASGWATVVPKPARLCIGRFFDNVKFIPRFTNAVFQLKLKNAGGELARFGINSTIGVAGLFDPADKWFGIKEHDNDFGTTLKTWGMSDGWFVVMPVGGPVNVRDTLGHFVDGAMNPMNYLVPAGGEVYETIAHSIEGLNERADNLDKFEGVPLQSDKDRPAMPNSPSLYETVRANYLQQQKQKNAENTTGVGAATAGAATAARVTVGSQQSQAAAIGTASEGAAYLSK
jgi:phospholipid-binding lipoprotein MlaA